MKTTLQQGLRMAGMVGLALVMSCGGNPLVGRWTATTQYPPGGIGGGPQGTITAVIEFGADNTLSQRITATAACTGDITQTGYKISVNSMSATSGTFTIAALGTCTGGPVQCPFGGMTINVAACGGGVGDMPSQYVLSANGMQLSLNGTLYSRAN